MNFTSVKQFTAGDFTPVTFSAACCVFVGSPFENVVGTWERFVA